MKNKLKIIILISTILITAVILGIIIIVQYNKQEKDSINANNSSDIEREIYENVKKANQEAQQIKESNLNEITEEEKIKMKEELNEIEQQLNQLIQNEMTEDITIQGIVELNHNGHIYIFNGQHFGEFGFEIAEYTSANIDNKKQKCIDYRTLKEFDTSYIQEGDILICTGALNRKSIGDNDFDTKDNPIIVLKSANYNKMKEDTVKREDTLTIGEYFENPKEIYLKYDISDGIYKLPFVLKANIKNDTKIEGKLEKGKRVKVQYRDLNVPVDELELKSIEVIEN